MINIATVHWMTDKWIDVQSRYLDRYVSEPYRVWTCLEGIDPCWYPRFHFVSEVSGTHAEKLNHLAVAITAASDPDDLLVFLDGDAFPVAELTPSLYAILAGYPLTAVRRDENLGEPQPHPCFCATTVRFWTDIGGDWSKGYTWRNAAGDIETDVGAALLQNLVERGIQWHPLLRTNHHDLDAVLFGVYGDGTHGDLIYHHGAAFRLAAGRLGRKYYGNSPEPPAPLPPGTSKLSPRRVRRKIEKALFQRRLLAFEERKERVVSEKATVGEQVFQKLVESDHFYRHL